MNKPIRPYCFDAWSAQRVPHDLFGTFDWPCHIDRSHVELIEKVFLHGFRNVLEVGCWKGSTTSMFCHYLFRGLDFRLTCNDINIQPALRSLTAPYADKVTLIDARSVDVLPRNEWDLIILDGDHEVENVAAESEILLATRPPTMILHDTSNAAPECAGPAKMKELLLLAPDYYCCEDNITRAAEWTQRGLFLATKDRGLFDAVHPFFHQA